MPKKQPFYSEEGKRRKKHHGDHLVAPWLAADQVLHRQKKRGRFNADRQQHPQKSIPQPERRDQQEGDEHGDTDEKQLEGREPLQFVMRLTYKVTYIGDEHPTSPLN